MRVLLSVALLAAILDLEASLVLRSIPRWRPRGQEGVGNMPILSRDAVSKATTKGALSEDEL